MHISNFIYCTISFFHVTYYRSNTWCKSGSRRMRGGSKAQLRKNFWLKMQYCVNARLRLYIHGDRTYTTTKLSISYHSIIKFIGIILPFQICFGTTSMIWLFFSSFVFFPRIQKASCKRQVHLLPLGHNRSVCMITWRLIH